MKHDSNSGNNRFNGIIPFSIIPIITLLFMFSIHHAHAFDCEKASSNVEKMICDDRKLLQLDEILTKTYTAVMAVVSDQDALKSEQRRWLATKRGRCADNECLVQAYEERISALERIWDKRFVSAGIATSRATANRHNLFDGEWTSCQLWKGDVICSSYTLVQQGERVCGEWEYWATCRTYSGQLQASLHSNNEAGMEQICGTPGSETGTDCDNDAMPHGSWEKASRALSICDGRLYSGKKATPCSVLLQSTGFFYHPLTGKERKRLLEQPWVKRCLSDG